MVRNVYELELMAEYGGPAIGIAPRGDHRKRQSPAPGRGNRDHQNRSESRSGCR